MEPRRHSPSQRPLPRALSRSPLPTQTKPPAMSEVDEAAFGASESSALLPGHPEVVGGTGYVPESAGHYERSLFHYSNVALLVSSAVQRFQIAVPYVAYRQYLRLALKATPSVQASILTLTIFLPLIVQVPLRQLLAGSAESRCNGLWLAAGGMLLGASWLVLGMYPVFGGVAPAVRVGGVLFARRVDECGPNSTLHLTSPHLNSTHRHLRLHTDSPVLRPHRYRTARCAAHGCGDPPSCRRACG